MFCTNISHLYVENDAFDLKFKNLKLIFPHFISSRTDTFFLKPVPAEWRCSQTTLRTSPIDILVIFYILIDYCCTLFIDLFIFFKKIKSFTQMNSAWLLFMEDKNTEIHVKLSNDILNISEN